MNIRFSELSNLEIEQLLIASSADFIPPLPPMATHDIQ